MHRLIVRDTSMKEKVTRGRNTKARDQNKVTGKLLCIKALLFTFEFEVDFDQSRPT